MCRERGFSLLEILVAFSILSLALGVLLNLFGGGIKLARVADDTARATELAESKLAQVGIVEPLSEGQTAGSFDERFRWFVRVQPYALANEEIDPETLPVHLYMVTVRIEWNDGSRIRSVNLATLRAAVDDRG